LLPNNPQQGGYLPVKAMGKSRDLSIALTGKVGSLATMGEEANKTGY